MDIMDFQEELLSTTRENIDLAKEYLKNRQVYSSSFNKLVVLIHNAGLEKSKKSIENKITELLSDATYGEVAKQYYSEMLKAEAEYKGLEIVTKAYSNHASALQSIMKMQISGEINENVKTKYGKV